MATVLADSNNVTSKRRSIPSRKVRIIGIIRGFTDRESESRSQNSKSWITVTKSESEKCKVFFESPSTCSRKDGYELDYCYEQNEEIDQIYSREIQPMILEVFDGGNASIIALGARGSGKTYSIQGLAVIAMAEILSKAKELGKSVSVSLYELTQEHVKDLLNPDHPAIQLLEDAHGKINIKGLSQVPVNTVNEFHDIYFSSQNSQKTPIDQPHKGLMVHISSDDDEVKANLANKLHFVDLAGYEDVRKNSRDGITPAETNRKNKSLYGLLNVVSAINANEMRVPYRESKLTRILQDSLGGRSHVLLLTCLNPFFCQDSLSTISLVSRSCRSIKQVLIDSTNRSQSSAKVKKLSSLESGKNMSSSAKVKKLSSLESGKKMSASSSAKKQSGHGQLPSTKKAGCILKARKLFDEVNVNSKQLKCQSENASLQKSKALPSLALVVAPFSLEEAPQDKSVAECSSSVEVEQMEDVNSEGLETQSMSKLEKILLPSAINDEPTVMMKTDISPRCGIHYLEDTLGVNLANTSEGNNYLLMKDNGSPPLSARIRLICNNLKALCESTITLPDDVVVPHNNQVSYNDIVEPKTPTMELTGARRSPQGSFSNRSSKVKDSLVQEYLNYLNSANKEQLKSLRGIGEKRATYILKMREESPEPFKSLDNLQDIGLSAKQIKGMMKQVAGGLFD